MPNMDGIEVIGELRKLEQFKSKPILVLSTEKNPAVIAAAREAGATHIGDKPLDKERFRALMEKLLP